ncbi:hypothetical protein KY495_09825 [Massilia sp. PAMC28688]|uniref:hypothetical protein n=1 Tax=Massilia sp. PAMC28688 TaxID=2861283 RepID=UPI001C6249B5|nr:hypothetical protein [Massilia sp. PAMC28688]QYF95417.1 hypothetical protein KY495_09825 [Massilia sp. PAMC28688]
MNFDDEYYFIRKNETNKCLPSLEPDTNTAERRYWYRPQPMTSPPLVFSNGWRTEFKEQGIKEELADILFEGSNFIVRDPIRHAILKLDLPDLHMHPAVYIDDSGTWHEDYCYVSFSKHFDCWDRKESTYFPRPINVAGQLMYKMMTYSLNEDVLRRTPLQKRLMFQMGQTTTAMIACHHSIAEIFRQDGLSGARLQAIKDY